MRDGRRYRFASLHAYAIVNGLPHSRIGFTVPGAYGSAPRRNRLKRLLREAFRLHKHELLRGFDIVLAPPRTPAGEPQLEPLRREMRRLMEKLNEEPAAAP